MPGPGGEEEPDSAWKGQGWAPGMAPWELLEVLVLDFKGLRVGGGLSGKRCRQQGGPKPRG